MSMRINIENILQNRQDIFLEIVKKISDSTIKSAKKELELDNTQIDEVLLDAIEMVLKDLNNEEGYISRLLYSIFGFEIRKNKRREQLIILGSQLKAQSINLKKDIYRTNQVLENISSSIKNLQRLKKAFEDKQMFLFDNTLLEKSKLYSDILSKKVALLKEQKISLEDKLDRLNQKDKIYKKVFKKIPRYYELSEDIYLQLTTPSKEKE